MTSRGMLARMPRLILLLVALTASAAPGPEDIARAQKAADDATAHTARGASPRPPTPTSRPGG